MTLCHDDSLPMTVFQVKAGGRSSTNGISKAKASNDSRAGVAEKSEGVT